MTLTPPAPDTLTPIDRYVARQQGATAVERFARLHEARQLVPTSYADERWYADGVPLTSPAPGEQYAFRVDLDRCSGCKACVAACHSLNGLDEGESWRGAGQLVGVTSARHQTVPTGCHHCVDPACLSGCPTDAYLKDPVTGIVKHLDDQCIGCSYCELTCPYEVPKLNKRLGVVRKCDMCSDRLGAGEAPACVQACPTNAISIAVVEQAAVVTDALDGALVPGAPASSITAPTTQYVSRRPLDDDLVAADHHAVHLSRSHPPLAFMLVLTQLSVGAFLSALAGDLLVDGGLSSAGAVGAAAAGVLALAASVLHLGRPLVAWRAVVGIRHSWLSREIVAFGAYAGLAVAYATAAATELLPSGARGALGAGAAIAGVAGIGCSALIYVATHRTWWRSRFTAPKFVLSAATTGPLALAAVLLVADAASRRPVSSPTLVVALASVAASASFLKLADEALLLRHARPAAAGDLHRTALLLTGPLSSMSRWRFACGALGVAGGVGLAAAASASDGVPDGIVLLAIAALALALVGELLERYQFFVASVAPRMPGGFR